MRSALVAVRAGCRVRRARPLRASLSCRFPFGYRPSFGLAFVSCRLRRFRLISRSLVARGIRRLLRFAVAVFPSPWFVAVGCDRCLRWLPRGFGVCSSSVSEFASGTGAASHSGHRVAVTRLPIGHSPPHASGCELATALLNCSKFRGVERPWARPLVGYGWDKIGGCRASMVIYPSDTSGR